MKLRAVDRAVIAANRLCAPQVWDSVPACKDRANANLLLFPPEV